MKIELVSNINMDSIKFYLKDYQLLGSCDFGNYMIDLIDINSQLHKSEAEIIFLFLDFDELNEDIKDVLSAVDIFIEKNITYYHVCYEVENLEESIQTFDKSIIISKPAEAVLFNNRRVAFIMTPIGIVELLEEES